MKLKPLNEVFDVTYGNKFDLNKMRVTSGENLGAIAFIGRSAKNNGVVAFVERIDKSDPFPAGCITVALGGAIMSSFVQSRPFYTAQNVAVLKPLFALTDEQLIYYCVAIFHNRFRYGAFGREANRTLRTLPVPAIEEIPSWVNSAGDNDIARLKEPLNRSAAVSLESVNWRTFTFGELFDIRKGKRLTKQNMTAGETNYIGSSDSRNGLTAKIGQKPIHEGNTITVCYNGSVAEAFYQSDPFWATDDVNVLYPRFTLNPYRALFLTTLIRNEKYRYNYGRKWHLGRMEKSELKLPVDREGNPDWKWMEEYIKALEYSSAIV